MIYKILFDGVLEDICFNKECEWSTMITKVGEELVADLTYSALQHFIECCIYGVAIVDNIIIVFNKSHNFAIHENIVKPIREAKLREFEEECGAQLLPLI